MLKLLSVTALASALALSTAALAPVSAGGHGMHMGGGGHYHFSHAGHFITTCILTILPISSIWANTTTIISIGGMAPTGPWAFLWPLAWPV